MAYNARVGDPLHSFENEDRGTRVFDILFIIRKKAKKEKKLTGPV